MNREPFLSILAMDFYNRGYSQGIKFNESDPNVGVNEIGRQLGNATIISQSDVDGDSPGLTAGFYAIAYDVGSVEGFAAGERVVSIRGTDEERARDVVNGYSTALGWPLSEQAELAIAFTRNVIGQSEYAVTVDNTIITGHSLGAGLAGLVAANDNATARLTWAA